jgi:gluconolactonase
MADATSRQKKRFVNCRRMIFASCAIACAFPEDEIGLRSANRPDNPKPSLFMKMTWSKMTLLVSTVLPLMAAAPQFFVEDQDELAKVVSPSAKIEKLAGGMKFVEGPVWIPREGGYLVFSDIPADELKRWSAKEGLTTFRQPSNKANGNTLDLEGRLITCEHGARRVSRTEKDGSVVTLVDSYQGRKLNSPNDAVVKSDGSIWFTDPGYGLDGREMEQEGEFVFRFDPKTNDLHPVVKDFDKPNGLAFSPDEKLLYIADSGKPAHIRVFEVKPDGRLSNGRVFATIDQGVPDGIRCDADGRLYSSAGDGVHIFMKDGTLIGKILTPESAANLTFGGENNQTLFITARTSLYSIPLLVKGDK